MNHARSAAASGFWRPRRAVPALLLAALWATPAPAQLGLGDLPAFDVDPTIDPRPFDPRLAIRDYVRSVLPGRWWANEPELYLGTYSVTIHVPDDWKGNPTSAVMNLCPPSQSVLWRNLERIELVPFYLKAPRARVTCRKG